MNDETYAKLLEGIRQELAENERDLQRAVERYNELVVRRRKLWNGYYGIKGLTQKGSGLNDDTINE